MAKSDREKRKEIPVGIFNAKKTNNPRRTESPDSDCGGYFDDTNYKLRGKERARFKEMLEDLLSAVPDTLTVDEAAELTGYHRRTILRYVQRKYIYAVTIMGKYYISKQSFEEVFESLFLCHKKRTPFDDLRDTFCSAKCTSAGLLLASNDLCLVSEPHFRSNEKRGSRASF